MLQFGRYNWSRANQLHNEISYDFFKGFKSQIWRGAKLQEAEVELHPKSFQTITTWRPQC